MITMTRILTRDMAPTLTALLNLVRQLDAREVDYDRDRLPTYGGDEPIGGGAARSWDETRELRYGGARGVGWHIVDRSAR